MNRKLLLLVSLLFFTTVISAGEYIYIHGVVKNLENLEPIPNHRVHITSSDHGGFHQILYTNENGEYYDTIYISQVIINHLRIFTHDCFNVMHDTLIHPLPTEINVDFIICSNQTSPDCKADFEAFPDPWNSKMMYFNNISVGNFTKVVWDFGDGNTSFDINPIHEYDTEGTYYVCLTISDNEGFCDDIYCDSLRVANYPSCEAQFYYEQDSLNPFMINFFDFSLGTLTSYNWDFGDGNISFEQNPSHIYADTGYYEVCLTVVNDDSANFCQDTYCGDVYVGNVANCISLFNYYIDSTSQTKFKYKFIDRSFGYPQEWYWDFGDGNFSYERHPSHVYQNEGVYDICLTVSSAAGQEAVCYDVSCMQVSTPNYLHFGGNVFIGDYPLNNPTHEGDTGVAYVYRYYGDSLIHKVDSSVFIDDGYYWFLDVLQGEYLVRIELTEHSTNYKKYIPAYKGNVPEWIQAESLMLADSNCYSTDIHLVPVIETEGPGRASGHVRISNDDMQTHGKFLESVSVILCDEVGNPLNWTKADKQGFFSFANLEMTTYMLKAEIAGYFAIPVMITLSEGMQEIHDINLKVMDYQTVGIEEIKHVENNPVYLYPVPVNDKLNIRWDDDYNVKATVSIYNMLGKEVFVKEDVLLIENTATEIRLTDFEPGIYMLLIRDSRQNTRVSKKFIKK